MNDLAKRLAALLLGAIVVAVVVWMRARETPAARPEPGRPPAERVPPRRDPPPAPRETAPPPARADGPPPARADDLPPEADVTLRRIAAGGPFAHRQDGATFGNRERRLPRRPTGYYREYTVETPGSRDRGARRIITGGDPPTEWFYTEDHYETFRAIEGAR